jgi:hypothetical protein
MSRAPAQGMRPSILKRYKWSAMTAQVKTFSQIAIPLVPLEVDALDDEGLFESSKRHLEKIQ